MPRPPQRCWRSAPKPCAGNTCPTEESRAGTGAPATRAARRAARCSSGLRRPACSGKWTDSGHRRARRPARPHPASPPVPRSLREALTEARRFLAHPVPPALHPASDAYDRTDAARNLWNRCRPHRRIPMPRPTFARGPFTAAGSRRLRFHPVARPIAPAAGRLAPPAGAGGRGHRRQR